MTVRDPRRIATAETALHILDSVPNPDDRAKFTGWIANRAGYTSGFDCAVTVYRALVYLTNRGLVERGVGPEFSNGAYWRKTPAGARWEGTAVQLAKPARTLERCPMPPKTVRIVPSPPAEPDPDPAVRDVADMLRRVQINYEREGAGPGSRFAGEMLETVQARAVVQHLRARALEQLGVDLTGLPPEQAHRLGEVTAALLGERESAMGLLYAVYLRWCVIAGDEVDRHDMDAVCEAVEAREPEIRRFLGYSDAG